MWHQTQYTQWFLLQFLSLKGRSRLMRSPSFLCHSIIPLNHIFTNSMKLMPLETTTTLSFLELVISTWWTCRNVNWEVNIMNFVKKNPSSGEIPQNYLCQDTRKTDIDKSYPIQGKHNFHLCKGKYAFLSFLQALYIKIWATNM